MSAPADGDGHGGQLVAQLVNFARLLRGAGLGIGPGRVLDAVSVLGSVDLSRRDDVYWALHAVFVSRGEERALFEQAFELFWREPGARSPAGARVAAREEPAALRRGPGASRRLAEARSGGPERPADRGPAPEGAGDAAGTASERERLWRRDFAQMSAEELRRARALVARMRLVRAERPTRRLRPSGRPGRLDLGASVRAGLRAGGRDLPLRWRVRARRAPPLVVLCDVSGSMGRYAEVLLQLLFALSSQRDRVHCFLFGTRLTHATRMLRHRDADVALARLAQAAQDWGGGTRIGACLEEFDRRWSRRVLGRGALVLLISDGLDRGDPRALARQVQRLRNSCRRLIWLNPLLRFENFEPRARGVRALLPHVDEHRPIHDLASLDHLATTL